MDNNNNKPVLYSHFCLLFGVWSLNLLNLFFSDGGTGTLCPKYA